jgi:uncharacterized repeat protein (TIGR01451 family)
MHMSNQTTTKMIRRTLLSAAMMLTLGALPVSAAGGGGGGGTTGADIGISGSASTGSPQAGSPMSYTYRVKNSGPQDATSVTFTNGLHSGFVYLSATVNGRAGLCSGAPDGGGGVIVSCNLGTIIKGSEAAVVVNVDAPMALGTFGVTASIASAVADPKTSDNSLLINVQVKNSAVATAPGVLPGPIYLRDSFGSDLFGNQTCWCRLDPAGFIVWIGGLSINGLRAEYPNISSEVWATPDVHQMPTWAFASSSLDPATVEPVGSLDGPGQNGVLCSNTNPTIASNNASLLPFVQPAGPVTLSTSIVSGWYTTAIGFTSSGALADNFETSGLAWFVIRMPTTTPGGQGSTATWELHTNGLAGPSASGTMVLGGFNHVAVSYDPTAGKVAASIEGVPVASLDYVVSGVQYAGFQGNGIVNDFLVQAGAIAAP